MALIVVDKVSLTQRLAQVSLALEPGELFGIIGPNGAGKSTLLESLAGLHPYQGKVVLDGRSLRALNPLQRARTIAFLPQKTETAWALRVRDVVALGRLPWGDESSPSIQRAIHDTGIDDWLDLPINQLSGGEQARVWIARLLAGDPRVILADEPLASLDLYFQQKILTLLRQYASKERSVMLSIHDLSLAAGWCDRLALMEAGRVIAIGTPSEVLTPENLKQVFRVDAEVDFNAAVPRLQINRRLNR